jgi:hypothetical protein
MGVKFFFTLRGNSVVWKIFGLKREGSNSRQEKIT